MVDPLISVIMPVFNAGKYLREAIESILNQTFTNYEFLIINDGSTDDSNAIVESYNDARIRLIDNKRNLGIAKSLNIGIDLAKGKYIARMDSDDISLPSRFHKQFQLMESDTADICGCHWYFINEAGSYIDARIVPLCQDTFTICLAFGVPFAHPSVMIRRSFLQGNSLKYSGVKYAEDYDFWIRLYERGAKFANVNDFLFKYRVYAVSLSRRNRKHIAVERKMLRRCFVRNNTLACTNAVRGLTGDSANLTTDERKYLLLASYLISRITKRPIIIDTAKHSDIKSIVMALLTIMNGF